VSILKVGLVSNLHLKFDNTNIDVFGVINSKIKIIGKESCKLIIDNQVFPMSL
jgi:hypothetical protein